MTWQDKFVEKARFIFTAELRKRGLFDTPVGQCEVFHFREAMEAALRAALPLIEVTPVMDEEGRDAVCQRTSVLPSGDIEVQDDMMPCALKAMLRACASEGKDQ
jgi:hypothetical protein